MSLGTTLRLAACAGLVWAGVPASSSALPVGRLLAPRQIGTVDTVAGPRFCTSPAKPDRSATQVGDVAADTTGTLWFQTGAPSGGLVTQVAGSTSVVVTGTGVDWSEPAGEGPGGGPPAASRLAPDGAGGVLVAAPGAILQLGEGGLRTVAGVTRPGAGGSQPEGRRGDGGPVRDARFGRIAAIAADGAGNVYVADVIDGEDGDVAIRFLNRSPQSATFYTGTPAQVVVAPGTIATIAGGPTGLPGPRHRVAARETVLAVAGARLYIGAALPGPGTRAAVHLVNLSGDDLSLHGVTVPAAGTSEVVTVAAAAAGGARLRALSGIAADDEGNLFLAEQSRHRVRVLGGGGALTTLAGTGAAGFNGNDRPAASARLDRPHDLAVGAAGRLYISDAGNRQVRFVDEAGTIRISLGNGAANRWLCSAGAPGATPGAAHAVRPGGPVRLTGDTAGNVYVAMRTLGQVQRLAPSGSLRPVAGRSRDACADRGGCPAGDDATPLSVALGILDGVATGPDGGLYVLEPERVRFVNLGTKRVGAHGVTVEAGAMRTLVGPPPSTTPPGDPLQAALAAAGNVRHTAVAVDGRGNLLVADLAPQGGSSGRVHQLDEGGAGSVLVDRPPPGAPVAPGASRCCHGPVDLATDRSGNVYIADATTRRVWFLNRGSSRVVVHGVGVAPGAVEAVAGAGDGGTQDEGVAAREAQLSDPSGIALDGAGNLYVADREEHTVHRVDVRGTITTVVGTGQQGFNGDGLKGRLTALDGPHDVVVDGCGNLLVTDTANDRVRRFNLAASCAAAPGTAKADAPFRPGVAPVAALGIVAAVAGGLAVRRARRCR